MTRLKSHHALFAGTLLLVALACPAASFSAERAFIQVESSDIETSESWYRKVFGLELVNRFNRLAFDQRILIGEDLILELVQSRPPRPAVPEKKLGFAKAGVEVADFDRKVAAWRAAGPAAKDGLFFDRSLGLATILLRDPDNNIVQIFGKSEGPFDVTVEVSPDFAPDPRDAASTGACNTC